MLVPSPRILAILAVLALSGVAGGAQAQIVGCGPWAGSSSGSRPVLRPCPAPGSQTTIPAPQPAGTNGR